MDVETYKLIVSQVHSLADAKMADAQRLDGMADSMAMSRSVLVRPQVVSLVRQSEAIKAEAAVLAAWTVADEVAYEAYREIGDMDRVAWKTTR